MCPGEAWSQWARPSHKNHSSRNCPLGLPVAQSDGGMFSSEVTSSQMSLGLCQVDKNQPAQPSSSRHHISNLTHMRTTVSSGRYRGRSASTRSLHHSCSCFKSFHMSKAIWACTGNAHQLEKKKEKKTPETILNRLISLWRPHRSSIQRRPSSKGWEGLPSPLPGFHQKHSAETPNTFTWPRLVVITSLGLLENFSTLTVASHGQAFCLGLILTLFSLFFSYLPGHRSILSLSLLPFPYILSGLMVPIWHLLNPYWHLRSLPEPTA